MKSHWNTHLWSSRICKQSWAVSETPSVAGEVLLGSRAAESFSRGEWARAVALVSQEPILFAGAATCGKF